MLMFQLGSKITRQAKDLDVLRCFVQSGMELNISKVSSGDDKSGIKKSPRWREEYTACSQKLLNGSLFS